MPAKNLKEYTDKISLKSVEKCEILKENSSDVEELIGNFFDSILKSGVFKLA